MYFDDAPEQQVPRLTGIVWRTLPMWLAFVPLLVFGLWWPHSFWNIFTQIAHDLMGGAQ
jgi:hydrogenase-4 component F